MTDMISESRVDKKDSDQSCKTTEVENGVNSEVSKNAETKDISRKPSHISQQAWDRFQSLQTRADNLVRRSTEKRIKHLQKQILDTVKEKLTTEEEREILRVHQVELDGRSPRVPTKDRPDITSKSSTTTEPKAASSEDYKHQIQQYLGINDHLRAEGKGPRSGLEKEINKAVTQGDVKKAEELSDRLANRDFAVKITEAADAREYLKRKKEEEELIKSKKKKKLNWGFEHKQRWETKSNM